MHARAVDDAAERLRSLNRERWGRLGTALAALVLAAVAAEVLPVLAVPLLVGGLAVGTLGLRSAWRHWALVDGLVGDSDAYVISEVRSHACREATEIRRRGFAELIQVRLAHHELMPDARVRTCAEELRALVDELRDGDLDLDPACAVACQRLVTDFAGSPLLNPAVHPDDLRSQVRRIRGGFSRREAAWQPGPERPSRPRTIPGCDTNERSRSDASPAPSSPTSRTSRTRPTGTRGSSRRGA